MAETSATTTVNASGNGWQSQVTLSPDTGAGAAYAAGDSLITNEVKFPNVVRQAGGRTVITAMNIASLTSHTSPAAMELWVYDRSVGSTIHVSNTAFSSAGGDTPNIQGVIPSGPYYSSGSTQISANGSVRLYARASGTYLIGIPVIRAAQHFVDANSIVLTLHGDYID